MPVQDLTWKQLTERHSALSSLCEGQQQTALLMMDEVRRLVYMQAPPGTGKTFCSATIAAAILADDSKAVILFVAPLNIATARLCEETQKALQKAGSEIPLLALFSGNGKHRYADHLQQISKHLLATAVSAPELREAFKSESDKKKVNHYLEQCSSNPRQTDEGAVARIFLEITKRRVFFCTLSLGEQIGSVFENVSHIILDEAGQAPYGQLLSFLSNFSSIKKVLVTGDRYQLHVNMMELPPAVHNGFGLDTAIINFDNAIPVDSTTLTTSFRSHPFITQCIEAGAYMDKGEKIVAGRTEEEMMLFTGNQNFKLPVQNSPLLFIHITDQMEQEDTSFSSSNPRQTDATIALLKVYVEHFHGTIRVVCLYAGQAADISRRCSEDGIDNIIVTTADSTQGYEADLTLVVTTLSGRSEQVGFWADEARVNVALSRSRHGLVLIGNISQLWRSGGIWRRYIQKGLEFTQIVTPEYLDFFVDPNSYFVNNILVGPNGQQLTAFGFYKGNKIPYFSQNISEMSTQPITFSSPSHFQDSPDHTSYAAVLSRNNDQAGRTFYARRSDEPQRQIGVCFRCHKKGHTVRNCPNRFVGER